MPNIRDLTKQQNTPTERKYGIAPSTSGEKRLDFRKASGNRFCLPYTHLVDVAFLQEGDGSENLQLDYTPYWHVTISGLNLLPIYEALLTHSVLWLHETGENDLVADTTLTETVILSISDSKLTDPAVSWEHLLRQRQAV